MYRHVRTYVYVAKNIQKIVEAVSAAPDVSVDTAAVANAALVIAAAQ